MQIFILLLLTIAAFMVMRHYSGDDHRIPPSSTPKGRQARLLMGTILIFLVSLWLWTTYGNRDHRNSAIWVLGFLILISWGVIRHIRFRDNKDK
jgi:hypothetical protein